MLSLCCCKLRVSSVFIVPGRLDPARVFRFRASICRLKLMSMAVKRLFLEVPAKVD